MAPRPINDTEVLLEIAIIAYQEPDQKFAGVYRKAIGRVPAHKHSEDSCRRRLQRKFNRDREYWLERGREEIRARRAAQMRQVRENMIAAAQNMRPFVDGMARFIEQNRPILESINRTLNSPQFQKVIKNMTHVQENMQIHPSNRKILKAPKS